MIHMAFSLSLDKNQSRYTDATEITEFSVKTEKIRSIREIRVPKFLYSDFEKAMDRAGSNLMRPPFLWEN